MLEKIKESTTIILAPVQKVVDKKMSVFYNPVMKLNRDISVLVLQAVKNYKMKIADPLAGSGIRTIRIINEVDNSKIENIFVNDKKENYKKYFEENLKINKLPKEKKEKMLVFNEDANIFLLQNKPFDYIDIDPFGSPNPFLDSACRSIRNKGILAITATDTSALCGTYPKACKRKYWAEPLKNELMHELGLRILIRKIQLIGAHHERALRVLCSYSIDHYMRVFLVFEKSKENTNKILEQHKEYDFEGKKYGPMYFGELNDLDFLKRMKSEAEENRENIDERSIKLVDSLIAETKIGGVGFHDIHKIAKRNKISIPKYELIFRELQKKGYKYSRTHFTDTGIKTDAPESEIEKIMKKAQ